MKYMIIFMLTILCLSSLISAAKIKKRTNVGFNELAKFSTEFIKAMHGGKLDKCFENWGSKDLQTKLCGTGKAGPFVALELMGGPLKVVSASILAATKKLCTDYLGVIEMFFANPFFFQIFSMVRRRRIFLGKSKGVLESIENDAKSVGSAMKTGAEEVGSAVKTGVEAVGSGVVKGTEAVGSGVATGTMAVVHGSEKVGSWVYSKMPSLKNVEKELGSFFTTIMKIFKSVKLVILRVILCGLAKYDLVVSFMDVYSAITLLASADGKKGFTAKGLIPLFLTRFICKWKLVMHALDMLDGMLLMSGEKKITQFAGFIGKLADVIGTIFSGDEFTQSPLPLTEKPELMQTDDVLKAVKSFTDNDDFLLQYKAQLKAKGSKKY